MEGGNSIGLQNHGGGKFNWPSTITRGGILLSRTVVMELFIVDSFSETNPQYYSVF
jgi:hypothetical protein